MQIQIAGKPKGLRFPRICVNCAQPAVSTISIQKAYYFEEDEGGPQTGEALTCPGVPVCAGCARQHGLELKRYPFGKRVLQAILRREMIAVGGAGVMGFLTADVFWKAVFRADLLGILMFGIVQLFFWGIAGGMFWASWRATAYKAVSPPTSVSSAFDLTCDTGKLFEGVRHRYTLRNEVFGEAFVEANRDRIWRPQSRRAHLAKQARQVLTAIAVIAGLALLILGLIYGDDE